MADLPTPERVDDWVRTGIHVQGRPEWVFVKVYTHGAVARDHEAVLGEWRDRMHAYLEQRYNDGANYVLHYVSAREAYNIAKAAEAGRSGNPNEFRDFVIPPPVNRVLVASTPFEIVSVNADRVIARFLAPPGSRVEARLRARGVAVDGDAAAVDIQPTPDDTAVAFTTAGEGVVTFDRHPSAFASKGQHDG